VLGQLEYGNKISILSGDYLLANACTGLAGLRYCKLLSFYENNIYSSSTSWLDLILRT
jgi:decaprenyl-diphosphate synthase subunit 2